MNVFEFLRRKVFADIVSFAAIINGRQVKEAFHLHTKTIREASQSYSRLRQGYGGINHLQIKTEPSISSLKSAGSYSVCAGEFIRNRLVVVLLLTLLAFLCVSCSGMSDFFKVYTKPYVEADGSLHIVRESSSDKLTVSEELQTAIFKGRETVGGKRGDILKAAGFILDKNIEDVRKIVPKGSVSELRAKFENDGSFSISYAVLEEIIFLNGNSEKDKPGHTVVSGTLLATRNGVSVAEKPFKVTLDKHETLFGVERVYMNDEEGKAPKKKSVNES